LVLEFSPFMLDVHEVVDSPAESAKFVYTQNEQEPEALARNLANQILQFGKLVDPVSLGLVAVRGTVGFSEGVLLPAKWRLTKGGAR
jgi:hypothetical protein